MSKVIDFLKDVRVELAKVSWPTRQELVRYTMIVIGASIAMAVFLGALDMVFQWLLQHFVTK